jgi:hypothetical protein
MLLCNCCHKSLSEKAFYDSNRTKCKKCIKAYQKRRRSTPGIRERILAHDNKRSKTAERKQYALDAQRRRRARNPEKYLGRQRVKRAIESGKLIPQPCEVCGDLNVQAHHDDYSKSFEVRWFCFQHHREHAHKQTVGTTPIQPFLIP